MAGLAGGAEVIALPESEISPAEVAERLRGAYRRGKTHAIVVIAEGARCGVKELMQHYEKERASIGFELRVTRLGHVVRGGAPSAADRVLATRLGARRRRVPRARRERHARRHRAQRNGGDASRRDRAADAARRRQLLELARVMAL
jgi:6-phosphofructokinase